MMGNINQAIELTESSINLCHHLQNEMKDSNPNLMNMIAKLYLMLIALYFNECFYKNKDETQYKQLVKKVYDLEEISKSWNM